MLRLGFLSELGGRGEMTRNAGNCCKIFVKRIGR